MNYINTYNEWLKSDFIDDETRKELKAIQGDDKEIEDRFYTELAFGTGGLRGIIGAGINRINKYTVRKAAQGLANYIVEENIDGEGVVIACDSRYKSEEFSVETGRVLAANGIKAYIFDEMRPTPELSFAVRELKASAGVVITASHNPPKYNGFKVYGPDGAQLAIEPANKLLGYINSLDIFKDVKIEEEQVLTEKSLIKFIGEEIDVKYLEKVKEQCINPQIVEEVANDFKVIYTPLHGAGRKPVQRILGMIGLKNVISIKEQDEPDPKFSTVKTPNPEDKETFKLAIEKAEKEDVDLIIATDPDCDRVGVVVRNTEGDYITLNGNQTGVLLLEYILSNKQVAGTLPSNAVVIKTIVTTEMARVIAENYNVEIIDVLTGFKFIGEKIKEFELKNNSKQFMFGFEESYGYLAGTYARDKDAVVGSMLIAEMACWYKSRGMSLYQGLQELYKKYGFYLEDLESITLEGKEGLEKIKNIIKTLRSNTPKEIGKYKVTAFRDYKEGKKYNFIKNKKESIDLPSSEVLYFEIEGNKNFVIRPSGTEPKIKMYFSVSENTIKDARESIDEFKKDVISIIKDV